MAAQRNLLFFCTHGQQYADFREVARRIHAQAPDIAVSVFTTRAAVKPILAASCLIWRPTVSVEMDKRLGRPRVLRGARLSHGGFDRSKIEQYKRLETLDIPVPRWAEILPDTRLDPAEWGAYVVVKPARGRRGAYVWTHKTGRVRFRPPSEYPEEHPGRKGPMLAQRFIHTGPWPLAYRVLTYFGKPIMAIRYEGRRDLAPLESAEAIRSAGGGLSIVASAKGCTVTLSDEADVLDLGGRAHTAFPLTPSLGVDIVRDAETGRLFIVEVNPGGESWSLTNDSGREMQAEFGLDFYGQLNALDRIAERSIEIAREYAR